MPTDHILLIHTDPAVRHVLENHVRSSGYRVSSATDVAEAALILSQNTLDVIVCENQILRGRGADFLEWVQDRLPRVVVVVLSSWADFEVALEGVERAMGIRGKLISSRFEMEEEPIMHASRVARTGEGVAAAGPIAQDLERQYPGITRLKKNSNGFLILGDR